MSETHIAPPDAVSELATKLDSKLTDVQGYTCISLASWLTDLRTRGSVEVGYRAQCGATHITMKIHREWVKVVKALRKCGFEITETPVKHKNAYATNNGGFWNSTVYSLTQLEAER